MEEVRRHRAPPGPVERVGSRARVGMLLIAALAVGGVVANWRPIDGDRADVRERPYITVADEHGEPVSIRSFEAQLVSVRGARLLGVQSKGYETGGVWILVRVRVTATTEDITLGYSALIDDRDREFLVSNRFTQPLAGGRTFQPGIPVEGEIAFEVPRDVATSLRLRLARRSLDQRMDGMAEIKLPPVDTATVDRWAREQDPVIMERPKVVP